ncbi:dermonecrotic toxin domain-containing protein [Pseudomonas sp.]|uniref:dermonecrotic toxin domain-containing protein n=1 Tax=Pseudomonas sp. TaxID=306 RepID=UPI003FD8BBC0
MTSPSRPYFHTESLKERFSRDVTDAVLAERIDEDEARWLRTLVGPSALDGTVIPPRLDRVIKTGGLPTDVELAAAVLISYPSSDTTVYLSTLLYGLERFDDREQLLVKLLKRFGSQTSDVPAFENQLIDEPLFEFRMLKIIDHQVQELVELAQHFEQTPSLQSILKYGLEGQIKTAIPETSIDPSTHILQIIQSTTRSSMKDVTAVQSLVDEALDEYIDRELPQGAEHRFLGPSGTTLDSLEAQPQRQALSDTVKELKTSFDNRLGHFWWSPVGHGQTRREYVAAALSECFRQALLARRHDAKLDAHEFRRVSSLLDPSLEQWGDGGQVRLRKLTLSLDHRDPSELAGVFLVEWIVPSLSELLLYSVGKGLRSFRNRRELSDHFSTGEGRTELLHYLSLDDHARVRTAARLQLAFENIDRPLFLDRVDSVIALQNRNLAFVIDQPRRDRDLAAVMIDDALDIRHLIDHRLSRLGGGGRWRDVPGTFGEAWRLTPSIPLALPPAKAVAATLSPSWLERMQTLDDASRLIWKAHPGIESCARDVLNRQLAILCDGRLDAKDVHVQLIEALPVEVLRNTAEARAGAVSPTMPPVDLITLLLDRVSGHRVVDVHVDNQIILAPATIAQTDPSTLLTPALVNHLLKYAHAQFPAALARQTRRFHTHALRQVNSRLDPRALSCEITAALLRLELNLKGRLDDLDQPAQVMLEQVLDYPVRSLRRVFGDAIVEVCALSCTYDEKRPSVQMTNLFMLHQPSLAPTGVVLWSSLLGVRRFDSLVGLKRLLIAKLANTHHREQWLDLFPEPEKCMIRKHLEQPDGNLLSIDTIPLNEHFIEQLQRVEQDRQCKAVEHAVQLATDCRLETKLFSNLVTAAQANDQMDAALDAMSGAIQSALFEAQMPAWLKKASIDDLQSYADVLKRYFRVGDPINDFLFGIPYLKAYAREKILDQLSIDFPGQSFDPDTLRITLTRYVGAPVGTGQTPSFLPAVTDVNTETLTEYSLNHFSTIQGASLAVSSAEESLATVLLTPAYLSELIHTLDVGAHYQKLLTQKLDSSHSDYSLRRRLFFKQLPALMIETAVQKKLEGQLSASAYDYIEGLMEMPDSLARQTVHEEDIILCPLRLIAQAGAMADSVPGFYVIGPKDPSQGPVILYSIFNQNFCFKEYADNASLLQDIRTSSSLQTQLMQRVTPDVQTRYGHHSFLLPPVWSTEFYTDFPMFSLGPITLDSEPVEGNVLQYLFRDAVSVFKEIAKTQTVTTAQADWESLTYLMTLQAEQVLIFLPGDLGLMAAGWQGLSLFHSSATSAASRHWGEAVSEFTAALAIFVSAKHSALKALEVDDSASEVLSDLDAPLGFSWRNAQLPPDVKVRLQAFEVSDIALSDLMKDELYNLYQAPLTLKKYAAVAGKVYQVQMQDEGAWHIVSGDNVGPNLKLNDHQQWELNVRWGLRGGGGLLTRPKSPDALTPSEIDAAVNHEFDVLASGMPAIRLGYRDHARRIGRAHLQTKRYIETCLENLNVRTPAAPLNAQVNTIIGEFFGVQTPSAGLVDAIKKSTTGLFNAVMDASLAPYSSPRFVLGVNRAGYETTVAFTLKADPLQRIYLSEQFFEASKYHLKPSAVGSAGFNLRSHYRAAALIHELSHLSNDTHDIAYLEATAPFLDLLAIDTPDQIRIKSDLEELHHRYLSHRTPISQLFKHFKNGQWQDINDEGEGKQFVLNITGQTTLADARPVFLADAEKRSEIILGNADSLGLLVTLLGRQRFAA